MHATHLDPPASTRSSRLRGLLSRSASSPNTSAPLSLPATGASRRHNTTHNLHTADTEAEAQSAVSPTRIKSGENGWIPTIQGRSGLSRESLYPATTSASPAPSNTATLMTRNRSTTAVAIGPIPATTATATATTSITTTTTSTTSTTSTTTTTATAPATTTAMSASSQLRNTSLESMSLSSVPFALPAISDSPNPPSGSNKELPTIRFIPHVETRSSRPSLHFTTLSRTLKTPNSVVRVGRYSERDSTIPEPNTLPVGFKSKVVSRRHCEFWCTDGQWYIKDVKSSSGTFLNHVRLSSPSTESRPYPVNDGDVVQLGIDFKGGEEVIFRCVKIRVECNRGWQKSLNAFNISAHKRLSRHALKQKAKDSDTASLNDPECSICLNAVSPMQALFGAPCGHLWHYKCIRNLIHSPQWPNFVCPNCRFVSDLEADVDQPEEDDLDMEAEDLEIPQPLVEENESSDDSGGQEGSEHALGTGRQSHQSGVASVPRISQDHLDEDLSALLSQTALRTPSPSAGASTPTGSGSSSGTRPIRILPSTSLRTTNDTLGSRSTTPTSHTQYALGASPVVGGH